MKFKANNKKSQISLQRRFAGFMYKVKLLTRVIIAILLLLFFFTDVFEDFKNHWKKKFFDQTIEYGLVLNNVIIEGDKNIVVQEIVDVIGSNKGDAILQVNLSAIKKRLEKNKWIANAMVERILPSTLYIAIVEKEPVAIWQFKNKLYLIDAEGDRIANYSSEYEEELIQVVGQDANIYAQTLLINLEKCEDLKKHVKSAVRFGHRRWNLNLDKGFFIKMPEKNFDAAYNKLCKFYKTKKLFDQNYEMIDLRDSKKMYFKKK